MSTLADRWKELRGPTSQKEMAETVGLKTTAWARYERGEVAPGAEILANICRVHACSADWLLGLERRSASGTVNGSGNVVAAGTGANAAKTVTSAVQAACKACPYKKALAKLQKAGLQIPGL